MDQFKGQMTAVFSRESRSVRANWFYDWCLHFAKSKCRNQS